MNHTKKILILSALSATLGLQTAQATSTFSATSLVTVTIDNIINNTNAGNLSDISITGGFWLDDTLTLSDDGFGKTVTGQANSSYSHIGNWQDNTLVIGDSLSQSFSAIGSATDGKVNSNYFSFGDMYFFNDSSDDYTIQYSINYLLATNVTGDFASSSISLSYSNELGNIDGYEEATASTLLNTSSFNSSTNNPDPLLTSFSLDLGAFEEDIFYTDVTITGYAEAKAKEIAPVPVPAAGWLMLSSLIFLRKYRISTT